MDKNKIEKIWNEFSKSKNIEFDYKERNLSGTIQSRYLVIYSTEIAIYNFIGMLSTTADGQMTDKTSIIIEYKSRLDVNDFEYTNINKEENALSKNEASEFEQNILKKLEKFNGNSIELKNSFIRIDANHIFSTLDQFEQIIDLATQIKEVESTI